VRGLRNTIADSEMLLQSVKEFDRQVLEATKTYPGDPPDAKTMQKLGQADTGLRSARANIRNVALRVTVQGKAPWTVHIDGHPLEADDGVALQQVVVQADGGSIRVEGDTTEARTLAEQAEKLERTLSQGLSEFGVRTLGELHELRDERADRKAALESLAKQRKAASGKTTEELQSRLAALQAEANEAERVRTSDGVVPDHDALSELDLKKRAQELAGEVSSIERNFEEGRKRRNALEGELKKADTHGSTQKCSQAEADAKSAAALKRAAAEKLEDDIKRQKTALESHRTTAIRKHDRLQEALLQLKARAHELQDQLDRESAAGVYSTVAELDRRLELGRERLERLELRDDASALIYGLLEGVRGKAVRRVVAPVKNELDHLLAQATRGRYRLAQLDDALLPRELEGDQSCKIEDGSQGLRELVAALVRLCVARHLAASGPQALLLDDPCVHVSKERTSMLVDIINQLTATGSVQAIILTHRGEEFMGLDGNVIDVSRIEL
jgi:hypothetical protein